MANKSVLFFGFDCEVFGLIIIKVDEIFFFILVVKDFIGKRVFIY